MLIIIISAIFIPACLSLVFSLIQKKSIKINKTMSNENFTVMMPDMFLSLGVITILISFLLMMGFTLFSEELPHYVFYVFTGLFIWVGMYLIVQTLTFRVNVNGEKITVYSFLRKPYSFTFNDIASAVRQVKNNQLNSERIVIKTLSGKRLIVENAEISYKRFRDKIQMKVKSEYLTGFDVY